MGLTEEQIEQMRRKLAGDDEPKNKHTSPEPTPKQKKSVIGRAISILVAVVVLYFAFGIGYNAYQIHTGKPFDTVNFGKLFTLIAELVKNKSEKEPEPLREFSSMEEANTWCEQNIELADSMPADTPKRKWYVYAKNRILVLAYDNYANQFNKTVQPEVKQFACSMVIMRVATHKTDEEWDKYHEDRVLKEFLPKVEAHLSGFTPNIKCPLNFKSIPKYKDSVLYDSDISSINKWEQREFYRLHNCIKSAIFDQYDEANKFIEELFRQALHPITPAAYERFRNAVDRVNAFSAPSSVLYNEVQIAASEQYAKNANTWKSYANKKLKAKLKRGRRIDRRLAKEQADRAYEEKHGYKPGEKCIYDDGKRRRRMLCADIPTTGSTWQEELSDIFGSINKTLQRRQQEENAKALAAQQAYLSVLKLQSETSEGIKSQAKGREGNGKCVTKEGITRAPCFKVDSSGNQCNRTKIINGKLQYYLCDSGDWQDENGKGTGGGGWSTCPFKDSSRCNVKSGMRAVGK